ncbi:hypothetical protein ACJJH9_07670 [Microbulbifer sp. DLAB2-AF]|uniref:hypothetical protein n=1 Tax=Microbulbifer sp. DLAB2-AF TaxID=3243395 RepID=UPI0040399FF7
MRVCPGLVWEAPTPPSNQFPTMPDQRATQTDSTVKPGNNARDNTCSNASANRIRLGHSAPAIHKGQEAPHEQQ